jgi:hypothetical protein
MAMSATLSARPPAPDLVLDTLREHAASLLGTARRYSMCADDAHDAYQRAVEIFLRRAHRLDRDGALPWLRTVVKHEALAVRAARLCLLGPCEVDLDAREAREAATPEERGRRRDADALGRGPPAPQAAGGARAAAQGAGPLLPRDLRPHGLVVHQCLTSSCTPAGSSVLIAPSGHAQDARMTRSRPATWWSRAATALHAAEACRCGVWS